jgi:hypothetical protein
MHNKYIITFECHDNAPWVWKVVQLEKYFDFSLYSHHFSLLSLTSLLSAPEREVTSPSDFKVVGALACKFYHSWRQLWSHDTVVLLLVTCQKGKLLCLLWSFLLYWTFCLLWGHLHAENETETSSENNNQKFTYTV